MEQEIAQRIKELMDNIQFEYHFYLILSDNGAIPLDLFFHKTNCNDEFVIANAIRNCLPGYEITDDGRHLSMKLPNLIGEQDIVYLETFDKKEIPKNTLYVNNHGAMHYCFFKKTDKCKYTMTKLEWNKRTREYYNLSKNKQMPVYPAKQAAIFTPGVIGYFNGVKPQTTSKIIKQLFEMVAPVAFVDYQVGNSDGYIRFKSSHGANLAQTYFNRQYIRQKDEYDAHGQLDALQSRQHFSHRVKGEITFEDAITLDILESNDENWYWEKIYEMQKVAADNEQIADHSGHRTWIDSDNLGHHVSKNTVLDPEIEHDELNGTKRHIKFDLSPESDRKHIKFDSSPENDRKHIEFGFDESNTLSDEPLIDSRKDKNVKKTRFKGRAYQEIRIYKKATA